MVFRLCYYSTNLVRRAKNPRDSELRKIASAAALNNRLLGISGGLMFNRSFFGQVLEGNRIPVSNLFCKIMRDSRHASIVLIGAESVATRMFERWSMGFAESTEAAAQMNSKYGFSEGFDPSKIGFDDFADYVLDMVNVEEKSMISVSVAAAAGKTDG